MSAATYGWVALGSALGGVARFWLSNFIAHRWPGHFPWGTLVVNVSGSFLIGFLGAMTTAGGRWQISPQCAYFLMVGVCGGYTTFSAFSLQTLALAQQQQYAPAVANIIASVGLCILFAWLGFRLGR